jgi:VCBS repeat-containing protein
MWFLVDVPPGQRDTTVLTVTALDDTQRQVTVPVQPPADGVPSDGTGG